MNPNEQWTDVDRYLTEQLRCSNPTLEAALQASADAGLPPINVSPNQGKFLMLLARACGARRILEIGTLGGYSTLWLARALPTDGNGKIVTLEYDPKHAEAARANFASAGVSETIELRVGPAQETLPALVAESAAPFDFIFIDADKQRYAEYFSWSMRLARPGSVIIADNVVRQGEVVDPDSEDERVQGVRRFYDAVAAEPRVSATAIQTVGSKGYDGFAMLIVNG